jgi:cytochrome P450
MVEKPPSAPGRLPVVGHIPRLLRDPLGALSRWGQRPEGVCRLDVAGRTVCLVTSPEAIGQVLATDSDRYRKADLVRDRLGSLQGGSLVLLEGEQWRDRRETLQPAFTRQRVASAAPTVVERTTERVREWPDNSPIRLVAECRSLVLDVLARVLFGLEFDGEHTPVHRAAEDILARMDLQSVSTYLPESVPTPTNRRFRRAVTTLHEELDAVVEDAAARVDGRTLSVADGEGERSLLEIMLGAGMEPATIRDELIALLFAGYDSTATALSCALALLGDSPGVQSAVRAELERVVGGRRPTPDDITSLPALDAVVKETLRLYPPQYLLFREPTADTRLDGYRIDAGTVVVPAPWVVHRDEQHWREPAAFRPARWLTGESALPGEHQPAQAAPEFAYIPYGVGSRHCLGAGMADLTLRLTVAVLLQHRQVSLLGSLSVGAGPTLSVDDSLELRTVRDSLG